MSVSVKFASFFKFPFNFLSTTTMSTNDDDYIPNMDPNAALTTIPITPQAQLLGDPNDIILLLPPTTPNHNMGPFTQ